MFFKKWFIHLPNMGVFHLFENLHYPLLFVFVLFHYIFSYSNRNF
jgi:hypothetical protein